MLGPIYKIIDKVFELPTKGQNKGTNAHPTIPKYCAIGTITGPYAYINHMLHSVSIKYVHPINIPLPWYVKTLH